MVEHIVVPEPNDAIPVTGELRRAERVGFLLVGVLTAVKLDDELSRGTGEVGDATPDRVLPPEFPSWTPFSKGAP